MQFAIRHDHGNIRISAAFILPSTHSLLVTHTLNTEHIMIRIAPHTFCALSTPLRAAAASTPALVAAAAVCSAAVASCSHVAFCTRSEAPPCVTVSVKAESTGQIQVRVHDECAMLGFDLKEKQFVDESRK